MSDHGSTALAVTYIGYGFKNPTNLGLSAEQYKAEIPVSFVTIIVKYLFQNFKREIFSILFYFTIGFTKTIPGKNKGKVSTE